MLYKHARFGAESNPPLSFSSLPRRKTVLSPVVGSPASMPPPASTAVPTASSVGQVRRYEPTRLAGGGAVLTTCNNAPVCTRAVSHCAHRGIRSSICCRLLAVVVSYYCFYIHTCDHNTLIQYVPTQLVFLRLCTGASRLFVRFSITLFETKNTYVSKWNAVL